MNSRFHGEVATEVAIASVKYLSNNNNNNKKKKKKKKKKKRKKKKKTDDTNAPFQKLLSF